MNRSFELPSFDILHNRFFNMLELVGDVQISYANVATLSFPFPSPISLLYKSKAGITFFLFSYWAALIVFDLMN